MYLKFLHVFLGSLILLFSTVVLAGDTDCELKSEDPKDMSAAEAKALNDAHSWLLQHSDEQSKKPAPKADKTNTDKTSPGPIEI